MITTLILTLVVFTILLLLLVSILLYAKAKLTPSGTLKITINEEKVLEVEAGSTLLSTLSENGVFLPSACGGGGTCVQCTCQVHSGGGSILPTEEPNFSRKEIAADWRLACQVKVREDMDIQIPEEVFGIKKWECEVISNYNVASFIKEFVVRVPDGEEINYKAGGYIQIEVPLISVDYKDMDITAHPDHHDEPDKFKAEWDGFGLWDLKMTNDEPTVRAYSMASYPAEGNLIMLNVRIATPPWDRANNKWMDVNPGICSSYIFNLKPGDKTIVSGPYGEFFIKDTGSEMLYVGGGAGMAPMRSHIFHLFKTLKTDRKVSYWYGGRSKRELFYVDEFRELEKEFPNFKFYMVLSEPTEEDNWKDKDGLDGEGDGFTGFVHQAVIDNYLSKLDEPEEIEVYFCGPPLMNQAVEKMCDDFGLPPENVSFDDFGG